MKNNKQKKNKTLGHVILLMFIGAILGGFSGYFSEKFNPVQFKNIFIYLENFVYNNSTIMYFVVLFANLAYSIFAYRRKKKEYEMFLQSENQEEDPSIELETVIMNFFIMLQFMTMVFYAKGTTADADNNFEDFNLFIFISVMVSYIISSIYNLVILKKFVDLDKSINPHLSNNVYSNSFDKEYIESMDERERQKAFEAYGKTFLFVNRFITFATIAFTLMTLLFDLSISYMLIFSFTYILLNGVLYFNIKRLND